MVKKQLKLTLSLATALLGACADTSTSPLAPAATPLTAKAPAQPVTLQIGGFSASPVIAMAQRHGFFADEKLTVVENRTPSSPVIFQKLRDGEWPVILTQIDNVFNYRLNPSNPLGGTFEPVAFFGTDWGNGASLMARPGYTADSIRGRNIIVDSPNSGFAFVLYGILRNAGLEKGVDYNVVVTGGTPGRYADLVKGYTVKGTDTIRVAATILNAGYQFRAASAGMQTLGQIPDAASPFMGGSGVALRGWLDANPGVATRFIRAYAGAQAYVLDPANKAEVLAWLTADAAGNTVVAEGTYGVLTTPGDGLIPDATIDAKGLLGTATLRNSFGGFDTPQNLDWLATPASGVYDLRYWHAATEDDEQ